MTPLAGRAALAACAALLFACQLDVALRRLPPEEAIVVAPANAADGAGGLPVDAAVLVEGARVFDERCSPCHGPGGRGDGPLAQVVPVRPRDYHTEEFKWGTRPSDIVATIRAGRSGVMPAFSEELTQRQIWAAAYVVWSWIPEERRGYDDVPADLESLTP